MITATKPEPIGRVYQIVSYGLGLVTVGMAVAQMVSFEEFMAAIRTYGLGMDATNLAILLILLEIFSVPFLFRLSLSPLARMVSALFVVVLPCVWTLLTMSVLTSSVQVPNAAYLGGFAESSVNGLTLLGNVVWLTVVGFSFGPLGGQRALRPALKR